MRLSNLHLVSRAPRDFLRLPRHGRNWYCPAWSCCINVVWGTIVATPRDSRTGWILLYPLHMIMSRSILIATTSVLATIHARPLSLNLRSVGKWLCIVVAVMLNIRETTTEWWTRRLARSSKYGWKWLVSYVELRADFIRTETVRELRSMVADRSNPLRCARGLNQLCDEFDMCVISII